MTILKIIILNQLKIVKKLGVFGNFKFRNALMSFVLIPKIRTVQKINKTWILRAFSNLNKNSLFRS